MQRGTPDCDSSCTCFGVVIFLFVLCGTTLHAADNKVNGRDPNQSSGPVLVTFHDALSRAGANEPQYRSAITAYGVARQNTVQSRAILLPNIAFTGSFVYTQAARFIANNGVHEYISQGNVHQDLSIQSVAEYKFARAQEALAKAEAAIATRGLTVTVVQAYYGFIVTQRRYATAQRAADVAQRFLDTTEKLEHGGEVAHSDTIKAQLQLQQQQRAFQDAELEMDRSRLELAVLILPTLNENFGTVDELDTVAALPSFKEAEAAAGSHNPDLGAAIVSLKAANQEVTVAWNNFLPSVTLDYFYGIDANQFAVNGTARSVNSVTGAIVEERFRNLGYSAVATVDLQIWNWGASRSKVKAAHLERNQAKLELSFAQRKLLSDLRTFYSEAQIARSELETLRQSAELASESLRLTTLRYQSGEATVLEVVGTQNTLTTTQNALGDGQLRYRVALAYLQTLTGKL